MPVLVFAPRVSPSEVFALVCGLTAVLGHVFSVFVGFKGGKGVATAAGVMLGLTPVALGVAAAVWVALVFLTGYVSRRAASPPPPCSRSRCSLLEPPAQPEMLWLDIAVAAAIVWFHRGNIQRLLKGTENRFGRRAATAPRP